MAKRKVKKVSVRYTTLGNNPNNRKVEKTIEKWINKGYRLEHQSETDVGCCLQIMLQRGKTTLTFIQE